MYRHLKHQNDISRSESTECQNCGKMIRWCDSDHIGRDTYDDQFSGVIDKLKHHINNDTECVRERKLKQILGEYKKLAQDYYLEI
jgi:hypothetical protein